MVEHSEVPPVKKMSRFTCLACPQPGRVGVTCRAYYSREMVNRKLKRYINFLDLSDELPDTMDIVLIPRIWRDVYDGQEI